LLVRQVRKQSFQTPDSNKAETLSGCPTPTPVR
ncbi:MAG: hypothetical protein ACI93T_002427, partial [Porticoccaceae bacterium]